MPVPWPQPLVNQSYCHAGGTGLYFPPPAPEAQACPPEPEHPCSTGQELSQARRQRQAAGAPRGRRETDTSGTVQQVSLCVSQCKRCWGLLWPQHSSGSVQCWGTPGSEPSLLAAPMEAEAVGTGSTLQPAAGQETPQGGARAQVAAAAKVEALSAWPAPGAPGHLFMPMGSIPIGIWGLPGHLEETGDQAPAWPAALQVPQGVGWCRARGQGDLLEGGHRAPLLC